MVSFEKESHVKNVNEGELGGSEMNHTKLVRTDEGDPLPHQDHGYAWFIVFCK